MRNVYKDVLHVILNLAKNHIINPITQEFQMTLDQCLKSQQTSNVCLCPIKAF